MLIRPFVKLRGKLQEYGYQNTDVAKLLRIHPCTVSEKLNAKSPWTLTEMYALMDAIFEPYELLFEYFPKNGQLTRKEFEKNARRSAALTGKRDEGRRIHG